MVKTNLSTILTVAVVAAITTIPWQFRSLKKRDRRRRVLNRKRRVTFVLNHGQREPLIDDLANCSAFFASLVAIPLPCHGEDTLKNPRSRTLSAVGKAEKKVGGQRT